MEAYQRLEIEWSKFNNLDPARMVACSSGTSALHLALEAMQLPQGSECICPDFTMVACARAVTLAGLVPVFVDCDDRLLMNTESVRILQDESPRVLMVVHVYGRRWDRIEILARTVNQPITHVIEDLAEAHGIKPHPQTDAACWSFYKNKIVAGEEGGAVWFRDREHARRARQLRSLGFTDAHDFQHVPRGHNYRMSNMHAEEILEGSDGLQWYTENVVRRRQIESAYDLYCPAEWRMPQRDAPWVYDFRIPGLSWIKQCEIVIALQRAGIAARFAFKPMSQQEEYANCRKVGGDNARAAAVEAIYLPLTPGTVTEASAKQAFDVIRQVLSLK